ncbi:hypothetical protein QBC38DRAFT_486985 [Podospora fimiseda]|uniref:Inhibitor I9 domain-containing protein n=1 Tax=Podospora fimiseda TaxID=252190 RepID=A0AAN7BIB9_9PEZI|nr:hypothetical protein QBC38DRAFT_486985 [Podospora fimiseda]
MPSYIITLNESATDSELAEAKQHVKDQGGKIVHEYSLIKGFSFELPEGTVSTLAKKPYVASVEADQEVTIQ